MGNRCDKIITVNKGSRPFISRHIGATHQLMSRPPSPPLPPPQLISPHLKPQLLQTLVWRGEVLAPAVLQQLLLTLVVCSCCVEMQEHQGMSDFVIYMLLSVVFRSFLLMWYTGQGAWFFVTAETLTTWALGLRSP